MKFILKHKNTIINIAAFFILWAISFYIRSFICEREIRRVAYMSGNEQPPSGIFAPFTIESATAFNYASRIASKELNILKPDIRLVGMENLDVNRQFNVANEYFLGYGYRIRSLLLGKTKLNQEDKIYEDDPVFASWARFQVRLWTSISAALIFLIIRIAGLPIHFAIIGALLHSISPAAIARHTGQEIVGETFTIPILLAALAFAYFYARKPGKIKLIAFAIFAFLSLATWDMSQIIFSILCIIELIRIACGGGSGNARKKLWLCLAGSSLLCAFIVPYHREHNLLFSPLLIALVPSVLICQKLFNHKDFSLTRFAKIAAIFLSLIALSTLIGKISGYSENYSHFAELIKAKIKFANVKPQNPALLSFTARVLWTPAMHSADMKILKSYFPAALHLTLFFIIALLVLSLFYSPTKKILKFRFGSIYLFLAFFIFYFVSFFFIVRYHSLLIIFLSILLPFSVYFIVHSFKPNSFVKKIITLVTGIMVLTALLLELAYTLGQKRFYEESFFAETAALIKWLRREDVSNKIFLADFRLSPMLLAYCNAGIILQPKFELGITRKKYQDYIMLLYHATERDFMKFCKENSADYFIFDLALAGPMTIYSSRYFANAPVISNNSPVGLMRNSQNRKKLRYFYEIQPPQDCKTLQNRYVVFKVISDDDSVNALKWTSDAKDFLKKGNINMAMRLAKAAVFADPNCYQARIFYAELFGKAAEIRLKGF